MEKFIFSFIVFKCSLQIMIAFEQSYSRCNCYIPFACKLQLRKTNMTQHHKSFLHEQINNMYTCIAIEHYSTPAQTAKTAYYSFPKPVFGYINISANLLRTLVSSHQIRHLTLMVRMPRKRIWQAYTCTNRYCGFM